MSQIILMTSGGKCARVKWTEAEKEKLRLLYAKHGEKCWELVPEYIQGRAGKDARQIWRYHLDPKLVKTPFTEAEKLELKRLREEYKIGWSAMEKHFPGRDQIRLKNEYSKIKRHQQQQHQSLASPAISAISAILQTLPVSQTPVQVFEEEEPMPDDIDSVSQFQENSCDSFEGMFNFDMSSYLSCDQFECSFSML
jgi:hypothetical protein